MNLALSAIPVPGLSAAWTVFEFIANGIDAITASKKQLVALTEAIAEFLTALNSAFEQAELVVANCEGQLKNLKRLLDEIHQCVDQEQKRTFLKSFVNTENQNNTIEFFYRRIAASSNAFQLSRAIDIQNMLSKNKLARKEDMDILHGRLQAFEPNKMQLREKLELNRTNILDIMVSLQRRLDHQQINHIERQFCSRTLDYLTSISGQQLKLEDWMIPSLEIESGPPIGVGGFGTVYRGTWKHINVAIKVLRNPSLEVCASASCMYMFFFEIIWSTLRHPNILGFLGANTLDDTPFLVMPYMPYNARQFLQNKPDVDPFHILWEVSLGLQYLHTHRICHGNIRGINILVEDSGRAVLCNFGLALIKSETASSSIQICHTLAAGSHNWMAPELLVGSSPKLSSDIYAFGMTIYELFADENPLSGIEHSEFCEVVCKRQIRPPRPSSKDTPRLTDEVWALAEQCWLHDPQARPLAEAILKTTATIFLKSAKQRVGDQGATMERLEGGPEEDAENILGTLSTVPAILGLKLTLETQKQFFRKFKAQLGNSTLEKQMQVPWELLEANTSIADPCVYGHPQSQSSILSTSKFIQGDLQQGPWLVIHQNLAFYVLRTLSLSDGAVHELLQLSRQWAQWDTLDSLANYRTV
ncbi:kinase-like domain-containing protein, partial [Mycena vitilis]